MKVKKVLMLILVLGLIINVFAGCSSSSGTNSADTKNSESSQTTNNTLPEEPSGESPVNATGFPIMNTNHRFRIVHGISGTDLISSWENKDFVKKIAEDTGLDIEWVGIPQTTYNDQVGIQIAAGDLPDAYFYGVPNFSQFVDSFVPLDDLIVEYAPTVNSFFEKYPAIKLASIFPDGAIYGLPQVQMNNTRASQSLSINRNWLEKLDMDAPNNTDELYEVLKAFKEKDPNGNGMADEIPLAFHKNETFGLYLAAFDIFGSMQKIKRDDPYPYLMIKDGKVVFFPEDKNYFEFLNYMNKLYSEGLMDPNGFVQEEADLYARGNNGQIGLFYNNSYDDIIAGEHADEYGYLLPLEDKNGKRNYFPNRYSGDVNINRFLITKKCEYPAAMVRLYDYLNSSLENRLYYDWGQEGVAWKHNEDNTISRLNSELPEGYKSYAEVRHTLSMGVMGPLLWSDEDHALFAITNPRDVKYYDRVAPYMEYAITEYIPIGQDSPEAAQEIAILLAEIETYMDNFQAEAIMKGIDESKWQQHLSNLKKYNTTRYVELRQEFYDRMMSLSK